MTRWLPPDLFLLFLPSNSWPFFFFFWSRLNTGLGQLQTSSALFFSYVFRMDLAQSLNLRLLSD